MHLELSFYQRNLAHLHYISTSMSELKIEERERALPDSMANLVEEKGPGGGVPVRVEAR